MRLCQNCAKPILPEKEARFCSGKCRSKNNYARKLEREAANVKLFAEDRGKFFRQLGFKSFMLDGVDVAKEYIAKRGRPSSKP